MIVEAGTVQVPHKAGGAEAQEVELRKVVADMRKPKDLLANMINTIWQSSSTKRCHQQFEQVMRNLTLTCEGLQPKADWLLDYYASPLPNKTCTQSVSDIFASGDDLVPALQVSRDAVASLKVSDETLRRYQALSFLRNWLVKLTRTHHDALVWAGFWDGDPQKRTTKGKLSNFKITGERNLSQSVLSTHEIPTVGLAAWGLGFWSPKVIVVDLMGTCSQTSPALQKQLFVRLPTWAKSMKHWSAEAFARRSRLQWQCIDCSGACSLDDALAEHVEKLVKAAKEAQDRKDQELRQVLSALAVQGAVLKLSTEEVGLSMKQLGSLATKGRFQNVKEVQERTLALARNLEEDIREAERGIPELDAAARQLKVKQLLKQNADPNVPDMLGCTALIYAAYKGHQEVIEPLLSAGAQLEARDEDGHTALIWAAARDHLQVVEVLLKARAQLEAHDVSGSTALIYAAKLGHLKVVEALVKAGAQLEAANDRGSTAFIDAADRGQMKVVQALIKAGAQLDAANSSTALIKAAQQGHLKLVEVLVKAGAQLEARNRYGVTALMKAAGEGHLNVVEVLLKAGAQLGAASRTGKTALFYAAESGHLNVVEALLQAGAQPDVADQYGVRAIEYASVRRRWNVVEAMLKARAQLGGSDVHGLSAVKALKEAGADWEAGNEDSI
ncbi:unnamed protein product [Symbiodinium sp. KB8]|nr:unnamed protein product [Symbiodinium sp. KB8]